MPDFTNSVEKFRESLPNKSTILKDYDDVHKAFMDNLSRLKGKGKEIRYLIVGEAPQSYVKYFYNPANEKDTAFLRKTSVLNALGKQGKKQKKSEMLEILSDYGILIVDLYPLPLDSYYYKHPNFYDRKELESYWCGIIKELSGMVSQKCKIAVRYNKLADRSDFIRFKELLENEFNIKPVDPVKLGGGSEKPDGGRTNNMDINETEFRKILNNAENNL